MKDEEKAKAIATAFEKVHKLNPFGINKMKNMTVVDTINLILNAIRAIHTHHLLEVNSKPLNEVLSSKTSKIGRSQSALKYRLHLEVAKCLIYKARSI